jgi:hypothetical protein
MAFAVSSRRGGDDGLSFRLGWATYGLRYRPPHSRHRSQRVRVLPVSVHESVHPTDERWLYLAFAMDVFSRRIGASTSLDRNCYDNAVKSRAARLRRCAAVRRPLVRAGSRLPAAVPEVADCPPLEVC